MKIYNGKINLIKKRLMKSDAKLKIVSLLSKVNISVFKCITALICLLPNVMFRNLLT